MKSARLCLVMAVLMAVTVGCLKHSYQVGTGAPHGDVVYESWHSHWFLGIIGGDMVDVSELCPGGNATIYNQVSFVNGLIAAFIGFVWSPTSVTITCERQTTEYDLSRDQAVSIVSDPAFLDYVGQVAPESLPLAEVAVTRAQAYKAAQQ